MRKLSRSDFDDLPEGPNHLVKTFNRGGIDITEHVIKDYEKLSDGTPVAMVIWDAGPKPKPLVNHRFVYNDDKSFDAGLYSARGAMGSTFDGVDWEWWQRRYDMLEKQERGEVEEAEE